MSVTSESLAIHGGKPAVTSAPPANWRHGAAELGEEEVQAAARAIRSQILFRYAKDRSQSTVAQFEDQFAKVCGVKHALAVNSGTSALIAGLVGIGVGQGDEVLIPAYTYIATAAAVLALGAFPVLVEVDESLTICPVDLERRITDRTRAVIPVHMRGTPCDMDRIMAVCGRRGLVVLEDVAQANGGAYRGRALGSFGQAGAFSLQHFKVMTTGEGGVVVTNDREIFERAAIYHDSAYAFWMEAQTEEPAARDAWRKRCFLGENFRMPELEGAVAGEQLKKRDKILARTRAIKRRLWAPCAALPGATMEAVRDADGDCGLSLVFFMPTAQDAVRTAEALQAEGVTCGTVFSKDFPDRHIFYHWEYVMEKRTPHASGYPWTAERSPRRVGYSREQCPRTAGLLERAVTLPIAQGMSDAYVGEVAAAVSKLARAGRW